MRELTERQKFILGLVIHEYIRTANPVGSNNLVRQYHLDFSSATVRNELAILTEAEYLNQPYTSAGRIPTGKGYRLFVSGLMQSWELPEKQRRMIEHQFSQAQEGTDGWMKLAASILASQSHAISLVSAPLPQRTSLKNTALLSVSGKQILMILILDGGQMQQRFLLMPELISQETLNEYAEKINSVFQGKNSEEIRVLSSQMQFDGDEMLEEIIRNLVRAMFEANAMKSGDVYTEGFGNVLSEPEFVESEDARRTLRMLEEKSELQSFLSNMSLDQKIGGVQVIIGGGALKMLRNCSMVIARYGSPKIATGTVGVLGPMRMAYSKNIPTVRFIAGLLSDLVSDTTVNA